MINVYYNPMRNLAIVLPFLAASVLTVGPLAGQPQSSLKTASLESHEGLTISALPWTDVAQYKEKFPKKSPFSAGVLAVQVVLRNDSDESMRVNLRRIRLTVLLDSDNRQEVEALTADQVAASRSWYDPQWHYAHDAETRAALDLLASGHFGGDAALFAPLYTTLTHADYYMHLADLKSYLEADQKVRTIALACC